VHLPDDLAQMPNPGRAALESLAIEGYRTGALSHFQASQLLGLSRIEFDGFLKEREIFDHAYDVEDLKQDLQAVQQDIEQRVNQYTAWLKECAGQNPVRIERATSRGPFPYEWNIYSADGSHLIDHIIFDGPAVAGSEPEKKQYLCKMLRDKLGSARQAGKLV